MVTNSILGHMVTNSILRIGGNRVGLDESGGLHSVVLLLHRATVTAQPPALPL